MFVDCCYLVWLEKMLGIMILIIRVVIVIVVLKIKLYDGDRVLVSNRIMIF